MRELKEIIKEIKQTEIRASMKEEEIPYKSRGGMLVSIRQACEKLPELLKEFEKTLIPAKLVAVYATGDQVVLNKVSSFVKENKGVVLDTNAMYRKITDRIEQTYGSNRTFTTTQHSIMIQGIREVALLFDYTELPAPKYVETTCPDSLCTLRHIKKIIRESIGDDLSNRYLKKNLVEQVLKILNPPKSVPILVLDVSTEEKNLLNQFFSTTNSYEFKPDFDVEPRKIIKLFKTQQTADEGTKE